MAQKLILPLDSCQMNAGYKMPRYKQQWGFTHYGADFIETNRKRTVKALGTGTVIAAGMDGAAPNQRLGNCIVVVYKDVELGDSRREDLACRMFHFDSIAVKAGDQLKAGSVIGEYGSTGAYSSGPHLHMEFDTDVAYPQYAFGIAQSGNIIKKGSLDSTVDPSKVLWLGQGQTLTTPREWIDEGWVSPESLRLPRIPLDNGADAIQRLQQELEEAQKDRERLAALLAQIHRMTG